MADELATFDPQTRAAIQAAEARARAALAAGNRAGAIAAWRDVTAIAPGLGDVWYEIGYYLRQERQPLAALEAYQAALDHGARDPQEIHLNRAVILADDLLRPDQAEAELRKALEIAPDYAPARLNLGNLMEDRGRADAAASEYNALLSDPNAPAHLAAQALSRHLRVIPPAETSDPRFSRLALLAADPALPNETRAQCDFERGQALEALGDASGAIAAYHRANATARAGTSPYDPARAVTAANAIVDTFAELHKTRPAEPGAGAASPIFICGLHRSGSTLLEQILGQHPALAPGGEIDWFPQLASSAIRPFPQGALQLDRAQAARWRDAYLSHLATLSPEAVTEGRRITDKRPENFLLIGLILFVFPGARILHTQRDPRDVAVSLYAQHLDPRLAPHACEPASIAAHLALHDDMMTRWRALFPDAILDVSYERLVAGPEAEIARVLVFLGLPPAEGLLDFHRSSHAVKTASAWQVRRPLNSASIGRWRRFEPHLADMFAAIEEAGLVQPRDQRA